MAEIPTHYIAGKPALKESAEDLRARIPGWGADLDPADRPSYPREQPGIDTGAHWDFPERQPEKWPRERSVEHAFLPPFSGPPPLPGAPPGPSGSTPTSTVRAGPRTGCCSSRRTGPTRGKATCARSLPCGRTTRSPKPVYSANSPATVSVPGSDKSARTSTTSGWIPWWWAGRGCLPAWAASSQCGRSGGRRWGGNDADLMRVRKQWKS